MSTRHRGVRRFGTPAYRASLPGAPQQPPRQFTQAELRQRRRAGFKAGHYDGTFSLAAEIAEVCDPLARRIAAADNPGRFCHATASVPWVVEEVHELVGVVVGWLTEADARRKTAHLASDPGGRAAAMTLLCDLAKRPALPEVTDDMLADGSWSAALIAMASGIDAGFADLLSHAYPPGAAGLRGRASRSERLDALLCRTIDRAALALQRRLDRDGHHRPAHIDHDPDERARAELAALGVKTN